MKWLSAAQPNEANQILGKVGFPKTSTQPTFNQDFAVIGWNYLVS